MERLIVWHRWCPPLDVTAEAVAQANMWRLSAREAFAQLGADPLSELSGTVVFSLPPGDLPRAVQLCFALSVSAEREDASAGHVAFALTLGQLDRVGVSGAFIGDVLDRAQLLVAAAGAGDVVLDDTAQGRLLSSHLFARELQAANGAPGFVLDRGQPYRDRCRDSIAHLGRPILPAVCGVQLEALRKLAGAPGRQRVLLVGARGSGASAWLAQLVHELAPPAWIDVRALGSGFAPLSGLMYALRRLTGPSALERVLDAGDDPDQQALKALQAIRMGQVVSRRDAIMGLRQYVGRCWERTGKKAFITVNPTALTDPASIGVVSEVARDGGPECFVVMRLWPDSKPPEGFLRAGGLSEVRVPSLSAQDAQRFAASMLDKAAPEISRRAAIMGGSSPLGVAEAVRVLLSSGDVVYRDGAFQWRRGPAGRMSTLGPDVLLDERIAPLPVTTLRVLEILSCVPEPSDQALVGDVALVEGVTTPLRTLAMEELTRLAFVDVGDDGDVRVACSVRDAVERAMSDARRAELYLRIATALAQHDASRGGFARANVAYFLARGGRTKDAVASLLDVASHAAAAGYVRSAVRLAAAAVECDPSEATQSEASRIAQTLSEASASQRPSAISVPAPAPLETQAPPAPAPTENKPFQEEPARPSERAEPTETRPRPSKRASIELSVDATGAAVTALVKGDREAFERALDMLVASSHDGAHVDRLRGLYALGRNEFNEAAEHFARARGRSGNAALALRSPRVLLSTALLCFGAGDACEAVRLALRALALAKAADDAPAAEAALRTLAFCYRRIGRSEDAKAFIGAIAAPLASAQAQG
jgi:tetratricopeptide (TPR) repeat protein